MPSKPHIYGPAEGYQHTHTIIFLHGRDSNADEFADELFESEASTAIIGQSPSATLLALLPTMKWVFPAAPVSRSRRFDTDMSQWFDMWAVEDPEEKSEIQREGLNESIRDIFELVTSEEKILPRDQIFLGGISQGFATVLAVLFAEGRGGFAGLIGLCSWMPLASRVEQQITLHVDSEEQVQKSDPLFSALQELYLPSLQADLSRQRPSPEIIRNTPVFVGHAKDDNVVPIENARLMIQALHHLGISVNSHKYEDGGHWLNEPQGVDDLVSFIIQHARYV